LCFESLKETAVGFVQLADGELNYQLDGPQDAPVLVLSNSLGTDLHMWDQQIPAFAEHFRVLRFDTRGHGRSLVTPGPYSIEQLGHDVLALLDALHIERAHFCGLSMGGLIGQWLGINAGERLRKLVVCNTAAKIGDPSVWNPRIETVLRDGPAAMVALRDASIARWFTADFAQAHPQQAKQITDMLAATSPQGYAANCAAVRDADLREQLSSIKVPMLVICGTEDAVTPPAGGHFIQEQVQGAEYAEFYAAHLSNVQAGAAFSDRVLDFLLAERRV
jgi:3-oxoadipate enol-lactonase